MNGKDDVLVTLRYGNRVYLNGQPRDYDGQVIGFNDAKDVLLNKDSTALKVNGTTVAEVGSGASLREGTSLVLGQPAYPSRGSFAKFDHAVMNNRGQVAFVAWFLPKGRIPSSYADRTRRKGVRAHLVNSTYRFSKTAPQLKVCALTYP